MSDTDQGSQAANLGGQLRGGQPDQGPPQNPYQIGVRSPYQIGIRSPWSMMLDRIRPPQGQPGIFSGERQDPYNMRPQDYIPAQGRADHNSWGKDDPVLEGARRYPGVTPGPFMPYGQAQLAQVFHQSAAGLANYGSGMVAPFGAAAAAYQTNFIKAQMQSQEWRARMNKLKMDEAAKKLEEEHRDEALRYGEIVAAYKDDPDKLKTKLYDYANERQDDRMKTFLDNGGVEAAKRVLQERDYYWLGLAKTNQQREDMDKQRLELEKQRIELEKQKVDDERRARDAEEAARARYGVPTPGTPATTPPSPTPAGPTPPATPPATSAAATPPGPTSPPATTPQTVVGHPLQGLGETAARRGLRDLGDDPKDPVMLEAKHAREEELNSAIDEAIRNNPDPESRLAAIDKIDHEAAQYYRDVGTYRVGARQRAGGHPSRGQDVAERIYGGRFDVNTQQLVQGYNSPNGQEFQRLSNSKFLAEEQRQVLLAVKALRDSGVKLDDTFGNSISAMTNMMGGPNAPLWGNLYQTLSNYAETVTRVNRGVGGAEADIRRQIDLGMQEFMGLPIGSMRGVIDKILIDSATAHSKVEGDNEIFKHATGRTGPDSNAPAYDPEVSKTFDALKRVDRKTLKFKGEVPDFFKDDEGNPLIYPEAPAAPRASTTRSGMPSQSDIDAEIERRRKARTQ